MQLQLTNKLVDGLFCYQSAVQVTDFFKIVDLQNSQLGV